MLGYLVSSVPISISISWGLYPQWLQKVADSLNSHHPFTQVSSITLSNYWSSSPVLIWFSFCRDNLAQGRWMGNKGENEACPHMSRGSPSTLGTLTVKLRGYTQAVYCQDLTGKVDRLEHKGIDMGVGWAAHETPPGTVEYFSLCYWSGHLALPQAYSEPESGVTFLPLLSWPKLAF